MEKIFNGIFILLIILIFAAIVKYIYNCNNIDHFAVNFSNEIDSIKLKNPIINNPNNEKTNIKFNYNLDSDINKQFQKEQEIGVHIYPNYPNQTISTQTISTEIINNPNTRLSYEFNKLKTENLDGVITNEISIKDVYNNSLVDYKKLVPTQNKYSAKIKEGASDLKFYSNNLWEYENDKPENGGKINNDENYDLFAYDHNNNLDSIY